jgi:NAD(P)-dependent dehydrogenase (short-subunit alcohol dehydrogenase family)
MKVVLITGLYRDFDRKLAAAFLREGYRVCAMGEEWIDGVIPLPEDLKEAAAALEKDYGHIDIYVEVSDERSPSDNFNVRSGLDEKLVHDLFEANVVCPLSRLEAFLPLIDSGDGRRLCYLTSAEASINETRGTDGYGYKMAKAALHNCLQITRNVLAPKGYTIRAYDPLYTEVSSEASAEAALNYFTRRRGVERGDERRDDEGNLVFRDAYGRQHAW